MDRIRVVGGRPLEGTVRISGAKNASLPELAASLLTERPLVLRNVPEVRDIRTMTRVLQALGASVESRVGGTVEVRASGLTSAEAPYDLVKTMRASVLVLGPLLARSGRARVSLPGGCAIGARPIDLHLMALEKMGATVDVDHGYVEARADRLRGAEIYFDIVTVTGTENAMMAACLAEGQTVIRNAACEPEIEDLADLLVSMGARIEGAGTPAVRIEGVSSLRGAEHRVIPDRIEAGTYLAACALAGGEIEVLDCRPRDLMAVIEKMRETGLRVEEGPANLRVRSARVIRPANVTTLPHPGFPTDMQAQYLALMTQAAGTSTITESIFENRFMHVAELQRMGAHVRLEGRTAVVTGPTSLLGAQLMATDLRASACLVLAALAAKGETIVDRVYHLDRGYYRIDEKLRGLGADIERLT
ncbi:MAG: UDP-N-acetylglucosamine 1-carboxyvinyltransferase [Acidobacteria bacterium RBG_16_70_10]|nr:MAG: UDP-N-acetylglucosamine 1-carboxyvinyltransferase [Acidobacteria bacterium RBG_16_70_10]